MDTVPAVAQIVAARYRAMSPDARLEAAASLFETARAIVESSLPADLSRTERRMAWARRVYGTEIPEAALRAFANHGAA